MTDIKEILDGLNADNPEGKKGWGKSEKVVNEPKPSVESPESGKETEQPKIEKLGGFNWKLMGIGAIVSTLGFIGIMTFGSTRNIALGLPAVLALFGGGAIIWWSLQKTSDSGIIIHAHGKPVNGPANAVNIYPDRIEFAQMPADKLLGYPHRLRNDGKYYYCHIWGTAWGGQEEELIEFKLPDTQYRDPRMLARYLNIPANRDLFKPQPSLLQKISPFLLLIGMGIITFLWIAA